jgi:hypothetical protein
VPAAGRDQRQAHGHGVAGVRRHFEQVRGEPPPCEGHRERISLPHEHHHAEARDQALEKGAAERFEDIAERSEDEVSQLVHAEVQTAEHAVVEGVRGVTPPEVREEGHRGRAHPPSPTSAGIRDLDVERFHSAGLRRSTFDRPRRSGA